DDYPATDARADSHIDYMFRPTPRPKYVFTERGSIRIILNEDGNVELLTKDIAQGNIVPTRQIGRRVDDTCIAIDWSRHCHPNTRNLVERDTRLIECLLYCSHRPWNHALWP